MSDTKAPKSPELEAAELRKTIAEAEKAEIEIAQARLELERDQFYHDKGMVEYAEKQSYNAENRVYVFDEGVTGGSVDRCAETIQAWARQSDKDITIIFNSGGGSVFDGLWLGDVIEGIIDSGIHVETIIHGMAASMAGILVQFGSHRVIGRNSWLHLHEVSTGSMGKASDLMDTAEHAKRLTMQACDIYARRGHKTADEVHAMMDRQEVWLTAPQALEYGFVDQIR